MNRTNRSLQAGQFTVNIDDDPGKLGELHGPDGKVVPSMGGTAEVRFGTTRWVLSQPARITASGDAAIAEYELSSNPKIYVQIKYQLHPEGKTVALVREVSVRADERLKEDLTVSLPNWPGKLPADTWLPLPDGTQGKLGAKPAGYDFQGPLGQEHAAIQLPMVTYQMADARRVTIATDPYFSTLFASDHVEWTYPKNVGLEDKIETRRVVTVIHGGTPVDALEAFYRFALPDVRPGPQWLHEIAMVNYDYMSAGGKGWFADIDALAAALTPEERGKVFVCMHAWFDWCGHYGFDAKANRFDKEWTTFGNSDRFKNISTQEDRDGDLVEIGFAMCEKVQMTPQLIRERLAYAKSKGFRVGLYFADGMNAGTGLAGFSQKLVLKEGGWSGPDTIGESYCMNPLVPEVYDFFTSYADAMLREFGDLADALVWDETFMVGSNTYGSLEAPGYSTRAMMRLVREVARKVERHNPQMALLASDCCGLCGSANYAVVAHGTYQDAWCEPKTWASGIYPNWRNTLWSCCWWPISKWKWVEFGVKNYQAPVSISNGWGDNTGFARMAPDMQKKVLELFRWRAQFRSQMQLMEIPPVFK
jgi:hypothetical protein